MVNALSRKTFSIDSFTAIRVEKQPLARDIHRLAYGLVRLQLSDDGAVLAFMEY